MKKLGSLSIILLSLIIFQSCQSGGKGSKQKTDSVNHTNDLMDKKAIQDTLEGQNKNQDTMSPPPTNSPNNASKDTTNSMNQNDFNSTRGSGNKN